MAASDSLNPQLFHGTTHWFQPGDIVKPGKDVFYPDDPGSYATNKLDTAKAFAFSRLRGDTFRNPAENKQLELFAPVFPVEHVSQHEDPWDQMTETSYVRDPKGFRVTGSPVGYVNNYIDHDFR